MQSQIFMNSTKNSHKNLYFKNDYNILKKSIYFIFGVDILVVSNAFLISLLFFMQLLNYSPTGKILANLNKQNYAKPSSLNKHILHLLLTTLSTLNLLQSGFCPPISPESLDLFQSHFSIITFIDFSVKIVLLIKLSHVIL